MVGNLIDCPFDKLFVTVHLISFDNDSLAFPNEHRRGENSSHWSANNSLTNESVATNQLIFSPLFDTYLAVPEW